MGKSYKKHRYNSLSFWKTMAKIKDRLSESHLELLKQTPFWPLISAVYNGVISERDLKSNNKIVRDIIACYNTGTKCFHFGATSASLTPKDISTILGLPLEGEIIEYGSFEPSSYTSNFTQKYFKDKKLAKKNVHDGLERALKGKGETGKGDVARLILLELFMTFLFRTDGCTVGWKLIKMCEELDSISTYSWAKAVADYLSNSLQRKSGHSTFHSVRGCVFVILFWLCERTNLIQPIQGREDCTPSIIKWDIQKLFEKLRGMDSVEKIGLSFHGAKHKENSKGKEKVDDRREEEEEEEEEEEGDSDNTVSLSEDEDEEEFLQAEMTHLGSVKLRTRSEYRYQVVLEEKLKMEKKCSELEEKHQSLMQEKLIVEKKCLELEEKLQSLMQEKLIVEKKCKYLEEKHKKDLVEMLNDCNKIDAKHEYEIKKKLYKEFVEKHKLELKEKLRVQVELKQLKEEHQSLFQENVEVKHKYAALQEKQQMELQEKLKTDNKCKELDEKYTLDLGAMLNAYNMLEEKYHSVLQKYEEDKEKCAALEQKHKIEAMEVEIKYAALQEKHELELLKVQNECKELEQKHQVELKECKAQLERYERLMEDVKNGRKEVIYVPESDTSPRNGYLGSSGTPKFSSGGPISDSDDDRAPKEKSPRVLKRKLASSLNTTDNTNGNDNLGQNNSSKMKQARKMSCRGSLVHHVSETVVGSDNDKGKRNNPLSHAKLMASNKPNDCNGDDNSTSTFSSDSEDEGPQSVVPKAKA